MPDKKLFALIALIALALFSALCTGCGGKGGTANTLLGTSTGDTQPQDYGQAIAGLTHATTPEGVDHTLWKELTAALANALEKRQASDAPLIEAARVNDLSFNLTLDPSTTFSWDYLNPGDYDLNGEANIADLSKIAEYFMVNETSPEWPSALVADGDGNGEVNLADVTLIAQNFKAVVSGYLLQVSDAETDAPWSDVGQMDYADAVVPEGGGVPRFSLELAAPEYGKYYRVVPFEKTGSDESVHTNTGAAGVPVLFTPDARGDWHTLGANAQHTSLSTHEGPTTNHVYWKHNIGGRGDSTPVYNVFGTIYVGGQDGLNIITPDGSSVLVYLTPAVVETTPAIAKDGTVYFGCNDGVFRAISPGGELKWSFTAGDAIRSSPVVGEDGTVLFGCDDSNLYALNPDGELKWKFQSDTQIRLSPTLTTGGYAFVESRSAYDLIDPDGQSVNEYTSQFSSNAPPLVGYMDYAPSQWENPETAPENPVETYILFDSSGLWGYPMDPALRALASPLTWTYPPGMLNTYVTPSIAPDGGLLVSGANDDQCKYDKNRNLEWHSKFDDQFFYGRVSASVDSRGKTYFGGSFKGLLALNPDGTKLWKWVGEHTSIFQVTITDSTLYLVNREGWLYAIGGPDNGELPAVPEGLSARQGKSTEKIEVSWSPVNGASKYEVYRDTQSNLVATVEVDEHNRAKLTDTDVTTGDLHEYWVRAVNIAGATEFTESVLGWTNLEKPENVEATQGVYTDKVVLTWDAVQNATSYGVYKDGSQENDLVIVVEGQITWTDYLTDWDSHSYYVDAQNSDSKSREPVGAQGFIIRGVGDSGAGSWNQYKANAGNTNMGSVVGPTEGSFAWANQMDSRFSIYNDTPTMFGSEGAIYVPQTYNLICFNPDGSLRWSVDANTNYPVIAMDGSVFISRELSGDRNLVILNSDGTDRLVSEEISPQAFAINEGGTLFATENFSVVSFNPDLTINWRYTHEHRNSNFPPLVSPDGTVYIVSYHWDPMGLPGAPGMPHPRYLSALNSDGTLRWEQYFADYIGSILVGQDGKLYIRDYNAEELVALNPDGSVAWTKAYPELEFTLASDAVGTLIVARSDSTVDAYFSDGTLKWSNSYAEFADLGFHRTPVIDSSGDIYLLGETSQGAVVLACDQDGAVKWNATRNTSSLGGMALDGFGRLIFCGWEDVDENQKHDLFCIGPPM